MINETDESQQIENIDFIFRVCVPLYILNDVTRRDSQQAEAIRTILKSAQYQCLIQQQVEGKPDSRGVVIRHVMERFI